MKEIITIAAQRKKISLEQAEREIQEIHKDKSAYKIDLALRHYFEDHTHPNHKIDEHDIYCVNKPKE